MTTKKPTDPVDDSILYVDHPQVGVYAMPDDTTPRTTLERVEALARPVLRDSTPIPPIPGIEQQFAVGVDPSVLALPESEKLAMIQSEELRRLRREHGLPEDLLQADLDAHPEWVAVDKMIRQQLGIAPTFDPLPLAPREGYDEGTREEQSLWDRQDDYIHEYVTSGGITQVALRNVGVKMSELKKWQQDPQFTERLAEATERWHEDLRKAAFIRAQSKSDVLLIFMLKSLKPDIYDDDVRKANWMAKQGLLGNDNLPVRATLVRDNTFNVVLPAQSLPASASIPSDRSVLLADLPADIPRVEQRQEKSFNPDAELNSEQWQEVAQTLQPPMPKDAQGEQEPSED